eukprot:9473472-Pyramimonas_sp.AAC.1
MQRGTDGEGVRSFLHGSFEYQDADLPMLDPGTEARVADAEGQPVDIEAEQMVSHACPDALEVELAADGSCSKPVLLELQRAGWAVVLLDPVSSLPLLVLYGAVPAAMPQSSVLAEFLGMAFSGQ